MTSDGISTDDWHRVHELALEVVNASAEGEEATSDEAALRLCELLDELQEKYGPLPSLLATRADYISDGPEERDYWLTAAYGQAQKLGDLKNLVSIAASLATLHVDDLRDPTIGGQWLAQLEEHLRLSHDDSEAEEAGRLRAILQSLKAQPQNEEMQLAESALGQSERGPRSSTRCWAYQRGSDVSHSVSQEDLRPYSASAYAWRWQDPRHSMLPPEVLDAIQAIRPERARELFPRSLELDKWAREAPARVMDVEVSSLPDISKWLRQLAPSDTLVVVSWHQRDAILVPWRVFAEHWDALWYPASDDVTVFPLSEAWALSCGHEGAYSWRGREHQP